MLTKIIARTRAILRVWHRSANLRWSDKAQGWVPRG